MSLGSTLSQIWIAFLPVSSYADYYTGLQCHLQARFHISTGFFFFSGVQFIKMFFFPLKSLRDSPSITNRIKCKPFSLFWFSLPFQSPFQPIQQSPLQPNHLGFPKNNVLFLTSGPLPEMPFIPHF